jgi:hypothetical protein
LGERRFFTTVIHYLADVRPTSVLKNLRLFAEYGRYDDLLALLGTKCEAALGKFIGAQLDADLTALNKGENVSLLAKWLPSINTSCVATREKARRICRLLGMKEQAYRKTLSALRARIGIVEDDLYLVTQQVVHHNPDTI